MVLLLILLPACGNGSLTLEPSGPAGDGDTSP